ARPPWQRPRIPWGQRSVDKKRAARKIDRRVGLLEMQAWGNLFVLQRQNGLDQPGDAGSDRQVADVGFHRADRTEALLRGPAAEYLSEGRYFDRIADRRSSSMGLDIADRLGVGVCDRL